MEGLRDEFHGLWVTLDDVADRASGLKAHIVAVQILTPNSPRRVENGGLRVGRC